MGFEAFVSCFENGESALLPFTLIDSAFAADIVQREESDGWQGGHWHRWHLEYPVEPSDDFPKTIVFNSKEYPCISRDCSVLHFSEEGDSSGLTFNITILDPAANPRFYESLLLILRASNTALYCAGECPPLVGKADSIPHLPVGMIESLGEPVIVQTPAEILSKLGGA